MRVCVCENVVASVILCCRVPNKSKVETHRKLPIRVVFFSFRPDNTINIVNPTQTCNLVLRRFLPTLCTLVYLYARGVSFVFIYWAPSHIRNSLGKLIRSLIFKTPRLTSVMVRLKIIRKHSHSVTYFHSNNLLRIAECFVGSLCFRDA